MENSEELLLTPEELSMAQVGHPPLGKVIEPELLQEVLQREWDKRKPELKAQLAKVLKHRLNRPRLREKIAQWLFHFDTSNDGYIQWGDAPENIKEYYREQADQILALIPDIDELRKVENQKGYVAGIKVRNTQLNEAKREERERIFTVLEKGCYHLLRDWVSCGICKECWQALKGE